MSIEGVLEKGFVTTSLDNLIKWAAAGYKQPRHKFVAVR
jgi:hypothetical protein